MKNKPACTPNEFEDFKNGSIHVFDLLFKVYHPRLYSYLYKICEEAYTSQDITFEAFRITWTRRHILQSEEHFVAYLFITAKCQYLAGMRKDQSRKRLENEWSHSQDNFYSNPADRERLKTNAIAILRMVMETMPQQRRTVFYKLYFEGKTVKETSTDMGLAPQTVRNHHSLGRIYLRRKLTCLEFAFVMIGLFLYLYGG
jgi:RNA polymerase sigma-70 factor (ECF subfamily)